MSQNSTSHIMSLNLDRFFVTIRTFFHKLCCLKPRSVLIKQLTHSAVRVILIHWSFSALKIYITIFLKVLI